MPVITFKADISDINPLELHDAVSVAFKEFFKEKGEELTVKSETIRLLEAQGKDWPDYTPELAKKENKFTASTKVKIWFE